MALPCDGMTEQEYRDMMMRRPSPEGNCYLGERTATPSPNTRRNGAAGRAQRHNTGQSANTMCRHHRSVWHLLIAPSPLACSPSTWQGARTLLAACVHARLRAVAQDNPPDVAGVL